jgi:AraC-like DNA-binding protein
MTTLLDNLLSRSLRFEYAGGDISAVRRPYDTDWRMLPDTVLTYQKSGSCRLSYRDRPSRTVTGRALIVFPAGVPHHCSVLSPSATYHWVHVNYYLLTNLDLFSFIKIPNVIEGPTAHRIGGIIKEWILFLRRALASDPLLLNARKNEMGFRILTVLCGRMKLCPQEQTTVKQLNQVWPALEEIHRHYAAPVNRDTLADRCSMSASQFHRLFFKAMGTGPMDYLRTTRLRQAQQLLLTTDTSIAEVARKVGYEDQFVFSRFFKRESGLNPTTYRRDHKPASLWKNQ